MNTYVLVVNWIYLRIDLEKKKNNFLIANGILTNKMGTDHLK